MTEMSFWERRSEAIKRLQVPSSAEYAEGAEAFRQGRDDCPYPVGSGWSRSSWWAGYLNARFPV